LTRGSSTVPKQGNAELAARAIGRGNPGFEGVCLGDEAGERVVALNVVRD
jgi:hypothetical protein